MIQDIIRVILFCELKIRTFVFLFLIYNKFAHNNATDIDSNNEINGVSKISGHPIIGHVFGQTLLHKCPKTCICTSLTIDCSNRGFSSVPHNLPTNVERLDLQGNNIVSVMANDFETLSNLRILRLNNNLIQKIPDNLFSNNLNLARLDISHNKLQKIGKKTFYGASSLKTLQLDYNEILCIDEGAVSSLKELEILTLHNNNLSTLAEGLFQNLYRLRTLRISENNFNCDCKLTWLAKWLRRYPKLGQYTRCSQPANLKGYSIADLHEQEFKCSVIFEESEDECGFTNSFCPTPCKCSDGIVDCREKMLTKIPNHLPDDMTELRLEQNQITEVPSKAFSNYRKLRRIDLSKNLIVKVASDAFHGLKALTSLVMYGNKIKELGSGVFHGLTSLQLLLLNANEITCIWKDTFRDLHNLNLLSLYDNNIKSLGNGTFSSMKSIQTLHLARNPFVCDCSLRWLAEFLHKNPIETSGAKCESPKSMQRRKIESLRDEKFKCVEDLHGASHTECNVDVACPAGCSCDGTIVDCSKLRLTEIPEDIPIQTTELLMSDNNITVIKADGLIGRLPNLHKLDFHRNSVVKVEQNAFEGASKLHELILSQNKLREINNKMFKGLHNLNVLSLYGNALTCVMPGSFDMLKNLQTLNLQSNPFICNCHLSWFSDWLRKKKLVDSNAKCSAPASLKGSVISEISSHNFKCTSDEEKGCLAEDYCPPKCTCTGTIIQCSMTKFNEVPRNLPVETSELDLQGNNITSIFVSNFENLSNLRVLDLSNNHVSVLTNHTFSNLSKLSTLIVSYNRIKCIERNAFVGLTSLRIISLHGNDISMIPDGVFSDLHAISHLALGSNPLYCDCNLQWLAEWVKKDFVEPGIAKCAEPAYMKDKLILNTPVSSFRCKDSVKKEILSKCNPCVSSPCTNNGVCQLQSGSNFICNCPPGYHGKLCDYVIDACYGNPCKSGGTCKLLEEGRFSCICPAGFVGDRCEINVDDCFNNKCQNNATCIDLIQTYECQCKMGYTGMYCEKKIPFCSKEFNPCQNGARCVDQFTYYTCECVTGFTGENCSINVDDCVNNLCQNGGVCVDGINDYTCKCPSDFSGKFCEIEPMVAMLYPQTSPCQHHDCKNGVCFQPMGSNDYICKCVSGYTGKRCEYLTGVSFVHNKSYVELEPLRTKPEANVTIVFSSTQNNGILLYDGQSEHLAVELFNGRIRVSYDVGNYPVSTIFSFETVSDGKYHVIELLSVKKNFTLRVDYGKARSILNEGNRDYLKLTSPLFIGGIPEEQGQEALNRWHLRNLTSFNGCMKAVWINHKLVDFLNSIKQHKITPGCGFIEEGERMLGEDDGEKDFIKEHVAEESEYDRTFENLDPCANNKCTRGSKCIPQSPSDYICKCSPGWSGKFCDQASTCKKEFAKEYFSERGCRSRKPIKIARCEGGCGVGCCRSKKTKKRKVRLICSDGTRYTKDIDIPRKCICSKTCY